MDIDSNFETYLFLSPSKLSIGVFEKYSLNKIYHKEILNKKFRFNNKKINEVYPVTHLDLKFEKIIKKIIRKFFIDHNIVGEEFGAENLNSDYTWYIDPIDGTKSFLMGLPNWSSTISN